MSTGNAAGGEGDRNSGRPGGGEPGPARRPRSTGAAVDDAVRAREEIGGALDGARRTGEATAIPGARTEPATEPADLSARDALLDVAVRGHRLALVLDGLAHRYATPGTARPSEAHVALDQAAAAAEDLGNCAKAAAAAIAEEADHRD
ncbi:hypothetical protein OOZ19_08425 [Saccharopolyspora sp. NFXS83]|uniref:hypothetical protein n=1 Tax=Saccharopolyspora sp. NFXS83 TaxID=2993560 RepID=UPI00224A8C89|nr:hypothetical protein [Saccharopolyspora sp. NFXS83]MCX2730262.1 hypothetical protein [Saccharopolyspora sp. NFXS83]